MFSTYFDSDSFEHLKKKCRDQVSAEELDWFVHRLCVSHPIVPQLHWAVYEPDIGMKASIVQRWEVVNVIDADEPISFLFSDKLIWDYKHRGQHGDYVFTSPIEVFDTQRGLVKTRNSLYCLSGEGLEVNATVLEVTKMRATKQPLHVVRAIERDIGTIMGCGE